MRAPRPTSGRLFCSTILIEPHLRYILPQVEQWRITRAFRKNTLRRTAVWRSSLGGLAPQVFGGASPQSCPLSPRYLAHFVACESVQRATRGERSRLVPYENHFSGVLSIIRCHVSSRRGARPTRHRTKFCPGPVDFRYAAITFIQEEILIFHCIAYSLSMIGKSLTKPQAKIC